MMDEAETYQRRRVLVAARTLHQSCSGNLESLEHVGAENDAELSCEEVARYSSSKAA